MRLVVTCECFNDLKDEDGKFMCRNVSPLDPSKPPKWNSSISGNHVLVWKDIDGCEVNSNNQGG